MIGFKASNRKGKIVLLLQRKTKTFKMILKYYLCRGKYQMKNHKNRVELGRSMVEMLGVLAIIGVLSVGAIAGYQKAMNKYRINKFLNDSDFLIRTILQHKDDIMVIGNGSLSATSRTEINSYAKVADAIPKSWSIKNDMIYDNIGGHYNFHIEKDGFGGYSGRTLAIDYFHDLSNPDICVAWFTQLLKPMTNVYFYFLQAFQIVYYGDDFCNGSSKKCISQATLSDIKSYCDRCNKVSSCYLGTRLY
jgi:type II secretory pathway pseudopilin PulG